MKLKSPKMLRKKPQDWLVVEFNGFRCTGIRVNVADGSLRIHQTAMSTEPKVEQSLSSVLRDLQTEDATPIRQAILITSQAAAAVVPLPINPAVASNRDQLQSLVQWEFEQVLSEHTAALSLETILAGRGCLSEDEIDDVRVAIGEQKASKSCISIAPKRQKKPLSKPLLTLRRSSHPNGLCQCRRCRIQPPSIGAIHAAG